MQLGKLLREAIRDIIHWASNYDRYETDSPAPSAKYPGVTSSGTSIGSSSTTNSDREMHFTITNANGGKIIKVHWYDHKTSREYVNLHIITDQEDLAGELAQIITRESLQR